MIRSNLVSLTTVATLALGLAACGCSIGHTIRPNGEVLEGNPAAPDAWVPLTAENVKTYYLLLLERVRAHMGAARP